MKDSDNFCHNKFSLKVQFLPINSEDMALYLLTKYNNLSWNMLNFELLVWRFWAKIAFFISLSSLLKDLPFSVSYKMAKDYIFTPLEMKLKYCFLT